MYSMQLMPVYVLYVLLHQICQRNMLVFRSGMAMGE